MGLGEMLLTLAGITAVLGVLMMVSNTVRAENADSQTKGILRQLNNAVTRYHAITQQYPPGPASVAIHYLQRLPESESHLRGLNMRADRDGFMTLFDGYGRPLNYNGADTRSRPGNFISPGPDGLFGDLKSPNPRMQQAVIDNIHSSDIPASTP